MDSCNSGSLQSSSGGDEEYDSRAAVADSLFMSSTRPPPHVVGSISNQPPPPPPLFDPLSNYVQLHQNLNNSSLLISPNISWPRPTSLRSDPNSHDIINPMLSTSSPPFMSAFQTPAAVGSADNNSPGTAQNPNQTAARNPKKRSRASRRAPTTVLTTDTTNFRAMVQEFTGIPPARLSNIFPENQTGSLRDEILRLGRGAAPPPPYLRRSFPQKVQSPPSFLASSSSSLLNSTTNNINIFSSVPSTSSSSASSSNYSS
ncbi:UNVERIFIED_CONTAM: hypothetical protein Scaly_0106700 [Sesamum calycinum]|uniref:VQ domain-containing protein n=1 Tax=Sesamum calycinum TaxID=2727403 RepID=A0AAW2SVY7_9LAMI